jgi:hypothetical protein
VFSNDSNNWTVATSLDEASQGQPGNHPPHVYPSSLLSDPNGWTKCNMYENRMKYFDQPFYQADGYNVSGFTGSNNTMSFNNYGREADEPFFVRVNFN